MRWLRDERGQATVLVGLCITCLCGMAALSVDVGMLFRQKRILQNAADAGAIAGAMEVPYNDYTTAAKAATAQNGITDGVSGVSVSVTKNADSSVSVVVTQSASTYFMKVFNISSMNVAAVAKAALGPGAGCIFTLNSSGVDVGLSGQGQLSMPDCGIIVDSTSAKALTLTGGSQISAKYIGIVGSYSDSSNAVNSLVPTPITGIAPASDPLGFESPPSYDPSSCQPDPKANPGGGQTVTIGPSIPGGTVCYSALSISGSGTVVMNPGTYIVTGAMSSSGSVTVSGATCSCDPGVTVYLAAPNGSLSLTGSGSLNIQAPCTGQYSAGCTSTYDGILFYQDPLDTNSMKVAGSSGSLVQGIFYAPAASLTLQGSSGAQFYANMVVNTLNISGNNFLQNYSKVNSSTPLTMPRLVQ